jgi:hypothetical protein
MENTLSMLHLLLETSGSTDVKLFTGLDQYWASYPGFLVKKLIIWTYISPISVDYTNDFMYYSNTLYVTANYLEKGTTMMLKTINPGTKTFKVFSALQNGERISASQANKRFGVANLAAEASRIRQAGYPVYANTRKAKNGVTVTEYRLGTPSRKVIAAGYKALALGLV